MSAQQTEPGAPNTRPAGRAETPPTIPIDLPVGGRELLGVLGQCELVDFEVLSFSGEFAPTLDDRIAVAELATAQVKRFNRVADQLHAHGWPVGDSLEAFREPLDAFAQATQPTDWPTAQLRSLLVSGLRTDFADKLSAAWPEPMARLISPGPVAWRIADFANRTLSQSLADDPDLAGSLALYGRRLAAEALGQCQRIAAKEVELTELVASAVPRPDDAQTGDMAALGAVSVLLEQLMEGHSRRMARLGLAS